MTSEYDAMKKLKQEILEIDCQINKCHEEWWEAQVANDWLDKDKRPKVFARKAKKENKRFQSTLLDSIVAETALIGKRSEIIEGTIGKGVSQFFPCKAKVWDNITYGRTLEGLDTHLKLWAWIKYRILDNEIPKLKPNNFDGFVPSSDTVRFVDHCLKKIGSRIRLDDETKCVKEGRDVSHLLATIVQKLEDEIKTNSAETKTEVSFKMPEDVLKEIWLDVFSYIREENMQGRKPSVRDIDKHFGSNDYFSAMTEDERLDRIRTGVIRAIQTNLKKYTRHKLKNEGRPNNGYMVLDG